MHFSSRIPATGNRILRRLLITASVCLAPFVILAVVVASYVTLDNDAVALRRQVMASTDNNWSIKVQIDLGRTTIRAVDFGLGFVPDKAMEEAHFAMTAVRRASVGVYDRVSLLPDKTQKQLFIETDLMMRARGWSRLMGIVNNQATVLVYIPDSSADEKSIKVCLAILSGRELVVVSSHLNAAALVALVKHNDIGNMRHRLGLKEGLTKI